MTGGIVVHGDFNCPWSYLASRRVDVLAADGLDVGWRSVEHAPRRPGLDAAPGAEELQTELARVRELLLPGEELPVGQIGSVPATWATTTAYAEAHAAGVAAPARRLLFDGFWVRGEAIADATVLRAGLSPLLRGSASTSEVVRDWGYPVDVTGGAVSSDAWRLVRRWREEWRALTPVVPVLQVPGAPPEIGVAAVQWLGRAIVDRGLEPAPPRQAPRPLPDPREQPGRGWVNMHGGRWLSRQQRLSASYRRAG